MYFEREQTITKIVQGASQTEKSKDNGKMKLLLAI